MLGNIFTILNIFNDNKTWLLEKSEVKSSDIDVEKIRVAQLVNVSFPNRNVPISVPFWQTIPLPFSSRYFFSLAQDGIDVKFRVNKE